LTQQPGSLGITIRQPIFQPTPILYRKLRILTSAS
jgi:hypothetical protein